MGRLSDGLNRAAIAFGTANSAVLEMRNSVGELLWSAREAGDSLEGMGKGVSSFRDEQEGVNAGGRSGGGGGALSSSSSHSTSVPHRKRTPRTSGLPRGGGWGGWRFGTNRPSGGGFGTDTEGTGQTFGRSMSGQAVTVSDPGTAAAVDRLHNTIKSRGGGGLL